MSNYATFAGEKEFDDGERGCIDSYLPIIRGKPISYKFWTNCASGLTVSLINVPLSIALAVASGVSPVMGIVTATWGAFFGGNKIKLSFLSTLCTFLRNLFTLTHLSLNCSNLGWFSF